MHQSLLQEMKRLLSSIAVTVALLGTMSSCSTVKSTSTVAPVSNTISTLTVADLNVTPQRVTKTVDWDFNPFIRLSIEARKKNLTAELLNEIGADVLVDAEYEVKTTWLGLGGGSITVYGYPAKYENFHKPTPCEVEMLKAVGKCANKAADKEKKKYLFF